MPTLAEYRREMLARDRSLGRVETIASLSTTSVTVNALATGTVNASKFINKWLVRGDNAAASNADWVRVCSAFSSSTGTLTHAGTNYADTTATGEKLEILEYEPYLYNTAIDLALRTTKREYRTIVALKQGLTRYWLGDLSWVQSPGDVTKVKRRSSRVLSNNRFMEDWNGVSTAGALTPDFWSLGGESGAVYARSTTASARGRYTLSVQKVTDDATFSQVIPVYANGVSGDSLRGQVVTGVAVAFSGNASSVRLRITSEDADGTVLSTTNTSYHTGGGSLEELSAEHTVHASAYQVRIQGRVEQVETARFDEAYIVHGSLSDDDRRDTDIDTSWPRVPFDQSGTLSITLPESAWGDQLAVYSMRPYPGFDPTRLVAGSADGDSQDAPLGLVAVKALALLYAGLAADQDSPTLHRKAAKWAYEADVLGQHHINNDEREGIPIPVSSFGPAARRF